MSLDLSALNWPDRRVILTGGAGFLGRNVHRVLLARGVPAANIRVVRSADTNLTDQLDTRDLLAHAFPDRRADVIIRSIVSWSSRDSGRVTIRW